jgi:diguanylate cyclase (GGDEF)-like protein/PAS domain S-box-containing protein
MGFQMTVHTGSSRGGLGREDSGRAAAGDGPAAGTTASAAETPGESRAHGVLVLDRDRVVRSALGPLLAELGVATAAIQGSPITDLIHPADVHRLSRVLRTIDLNPEHVGSLPFRMADGSGAWVPVAAIVSRGEEGSSPMFLMSLRRDRTLPGEAYGGVTRFDHLVHRSICRLAETTPLAWDCTVDSTLEALARALGADAAHYGLLDAKVGAFCQFAEWPAPPVAMLDEVVIALSCSARPLLFERLANLEAIVSSEDDNELAILSQNQRSRLDPPGSSLAIPIALEHGLVGVVWFDRVGSDGFWDETLFDPVRLAGELLGGLATVVGDRRWRSEVESSVRAVFEDAPVPMAVLQLSGEFRDANVEFRKLFGISSEHLAELTIAEVVAAHDRPSVGGLLERCRTDREAVLFKYEVQMLVRGRPQWCRLGARVVRSGDGSAESIMITVEDLHELKFSEETKRRAARRYEDLLGLLPDPMFLFDPSGEVRFANGAAMEQFHSYFDNQTRRWAIQGLAREWLRAVEDTTPRSRHRSIEQELIHGGRKRFFEIRLVAEFSSDDEVESVLVVLRDLTERQDAIEQLEHQASHDSLTMLPNRAAFLRKLETALARLAVRRTQVAVLFFDLDRFKVVNDSLGHSVGDDLLKVAADRLQGALRPTDTLARLGGDEFTVLIEGVTSPEVVKRVVHRLLSALSQPVELNNHEFKLSASVGIAMTGDPDERSLELLRWADAAMYRAKAMGPGHFSFFDDELSAVVKDRLDLDQRLVNALARREVRVHFQPEVDLRTGQVVGCEALLRWAHPERGMLSLGEFARVAEESGAIVGLGAWVISQACAHAALWREMAGDHFILRVNMSVRELERDDVLDLVDQSLKSASLPPESLCIELTETAMMANPERNMAALLAFADMGVELAIDDFGTGYSSLAYLKRLPVDILKIDRSFVGGLPNDDDDRALVEVIVKLGETMGLQVTAEGIESRGQREALVDLGCHRGQGFLFDRALDAGSFTELLVSGGAYDLASLADWIDTGESSTISSLR